MRFLRSIATLGLNALPEDQTLVRIEALLRALKSNALDLDTLNDLLRRSANGDGDADHAVHSFLDAWNKSRDARPTFAAFYDEVRHDADHADWPHALRDRLGLGHHVAGTTAPPLPVALMRYSLADVFAVHEPRELACCCAVPTVLDGGMDQFFFPVPRQHPYGAAVHLAPDQSDTLTAEIVHCRINYKRDHLWRLGWITRPHHVAKDLLPEARDRHLLALQLACDRPDFGEPFAGRT